MNKGIEFERDFSKKFHFSDIPFLISSKHLRKNQLGQIDMAKARLGPQKKIQEVYVLELKYSAYPTTIQMKRLSKTCGYLSQVLNVDIKFKIKLCKNPSNSLFY